MAKPKNPSYQALKHAIEEHPAPWIFCPVLNKDGFVVGWNIFDARGSFLLRISEEQLARRIVAAINAREIKCPK